MRSPLDSIIFQRILDEARDLVADASSPEEAAARACHGAWAVYRPVVLEALTRPGDTARGPGPDGTA
ncbi:MAG TPA: hypothetical protein VGC25_00715 [Alphaproteobacteria bacterium]|jgi:hypothetical protein